MKRCQDLLGIILKRSAGCYDQRLTLTLDKGCVLRCAVQPSVKAVVPINQCFHLGTEPPMVKGRSKNDHITCHHPLDDIRDIILLNAARIG